MDNTTTITEISPVDSEMCRIIIEMVWLSGIAVSVSCLLMQFAFFALIRSSRKTDEQILAQITATRILVTICEYVLVYPQIYLDFVFTLYFLSDFALVCWMLVFTKNLYDKIVVVFSNRRLNLVLTSFLVWIMSLPVAVVGVFILKNHRNLFGVYCRLIYALIKFVIVIVIIIIYLRIFYVAFRRSSESTRNFRDIVRSACVAFLLITTTSLQILITDLISYINGITNMMLVKIFCVINSFHAVFITAIFIIIMKGKLQDSIGNTVMMRLAKVVT